MFRGDPRPSCGVRYQALVNLFSNVCKNVQGQHPLKAEMYSLPKKVHYGLYTLGSMTFSFMDQSTPTFFTQRGRGGS